MVFYAFVKWSTSDASYRYLVTAPDADTMDEWWRKVSEKQEDYKRLSPDFYTYEKVNPHEVIPEMTNRMLFTLMNDRDSRTLSTFPHQDRVDHVSGRTFYIRAKGNPKLYWSEYTNGYIYASEKSRTRFRITIDGDDKSKVMIGDDFIIISSAKDSKRKLGESDQGQLYLGGHSCRLRFSDLKKNFLAEVEGDNQDSPVMKIDGVGEIWELVA